MQKIKNRTNILIINIFNSCNNITFYILYFYHYNDIYFISFIYVF